MNVPMTTGNCNNICWGSSDCPISSLEPLEPADFDASKLRDLSPILLQDLMNLTFMSDEKLSTNPLYPKTQSSQPGMFVYEKKSSPSVERDASAANNNQQKQDDENIARVANRTCRLEDELNDHNADKKPVVPASLPPRSGSEGDDEALLSVSESLSLPFVSCSEDSSSSRTACTELQPRPETLKRTASAFQRGANPVSEHGLASGAYPLEKLGNYW